MAKEAEFQIEFEREGKGFVEYVKASDLARRISDLQVTGVHHVRVFKSRI